VYARAHHVDENKRQKALITMQNQRQSCAIACHLVLILHTCVALHHSHVQIVAFTILQPNKSRPILRKHARLRWV
jgi:hypothetical protein